MRKFVVIAIIFLLSYGCASHSPIKPPNLQSDISAQQNRRYLNGVDVMVRVVHSKTDLKAYYDEDLILFGMLPFHVCFMNKKDCPCHVGPEHVTLISPDGMASAPLGLEQVCSKASKSYWRTAGWGVAFGLIGAIPSLINVSTTNERLKADYQASMLKSGDLPGGGYTEGSIFFDIDKKIETLDGWKLKVGLEEKESVAFLTFDLQGEVEQPRAENENASNK